MVRIVGGNETGVPVISSLSLYLQSLKGPFKHDLACFAEAFLKAGGPAWGLDEEGSGFMDSYILQLL